MAREQSAFRGVFVGVGVVGFRGGGSVVEFLADAREGRGHGEVLEVGAGVKGGLGGEGCKRDCGVEDFVFEVEFEDGFAVFFGWKVDEEAAGETAQGCFVEIEGAVGGYHDECRQLVHAVPFAEELVD